VRLRINDSKAVIPHPGAGAASRKPAAAVSAGTLGPTLLCAFRVLKSLSSAVSGGGCSSWAWWKSKGWEMDCSASVPGCPCRDSTVFVGGRAGAAAWPGSLIRVSGFFWLVAICQEVIVLSWIPLSCWK